MICFNIKNHKGFTLIETLFAILIFSAALISLMAIAGRGISATNSAREQITAHYLAQEGLEVIRNLRDNDMATGWSNRFDFCTSDNPCFVNYQGGFDIPIVVKCGGQCPFVQTANGDFVDTGVDSPYLRTITIEPLHKDDTLGFVDEYRITSRVDWLAKTVKRSVTLETILKKWQ